MHFLKTNLNQAILIDESFFEDKESFLNNIDYLNNVLLNEDEKAKEILKGTIFDDEDVLQRKLIIISRAANFAEKFHSYFHFEEAYFHFVYANFLVKFHAPGSPQEELQKIIDHFEISIKQFKFNEFVHFNLIEFCKKNFDESKQKQCIQRFESLFQKKYEKRDGFADFKYERQFRSFEEYIQFALSCSKNHLEKIRPQIQKKFLEKNFYSSFEKFSSFSNFFISSQHQDLSKIKEIGDEFLKEISEAHKAYHQNAAKIYYNYSIIHEALNQKMHSQNLLRKVQNLDPKLLESLE
jgi:hypothetical protein